MSLLHNRFTGSKNCFIDVTDIPSVLCWGNPQNIPQPLYSFVVPTYKRPRLLEMALKSILGQTEQLPVEIIVVDNDVEDTRLQTLALVRQLHDPRLLYYQNEHNLGGCGNWNRGIQLARSNWVMMLHDDDLLMPDYLAKMHRFLGNYTHKDTLGYIQSCVIPFHGDELPEHGIIIPSEVGLMRRFLGSRTHISAIRKSTLDICLNGGFGWVSAPTCGAVLSRKAMLDIGGFDQDLSPCPDVFAVFKLMANYDVLQPMPAMAYYRWLNNDTYNPQTMAGLIQRNEELLDFLQSQSSFVKFFKECFYADLIETYQRKANEAHRTLPEATLQSMGRHQARPIRRKLLHGVQKLVKFTDLLRFALS